MIVAIEGIDGSGKTTQAKMLVEKLKDAGHNAICVRPLYTFIKENNQRTTISPRRARVHETHAFIKIILGIVGYLYGLACYLVIRFRLGRGKVVVCDRYFYQFFFDLFGQFGLKMVAAFPKPDIVFILTAEPSTLFSRMTSSFDRSVNRDYYEKVSKLYYKLSEKYDFVWIDANLNKKRISDIIFEHLSKKLEK